MYDNRRIVLEVQINYFQKDNDVDIYMETLITSFFINFIGHLSYSYIFNIAILNRDHVKIYLLIESLLIIKLSMINSNH